MTTIHCPTCFGVRTMTAGGGPIHVRWCQCPAQPDPKDAEIARLRDLAKERDDELFQAQAEIARLRALVREAFHEGFKAAYCTALTDEEAVAEFERSAAKKALDP